MTLRVIRLDFYDAVRYIGDVKRGRPTAAQRVITRYGNRKLYDPAAGRYVTLEDLAVLVARGIEVRVLDQKTGGDITRIVLAQVILEGLRERTARIPSQVLARLIRLGKARASAWGSWASPQQAAARARDEAERIVARLLAKGRLTLEEGLGLRRDIASVVQRMAGDAQRGFEQRVQGLLERVESESEVHPALERFKERLLAFEASLPASPGRRQRKRPHKTVGTRRKRRPARRTRETGGTS
jgi:polyhydroxyalkanoate synthesis repressor PhaR